MTDPITRLNTALEGRYHIERELGSGGMASVYLAQDLKRRLSEYYQAIDRGEQWSGNWRRIQMDLEHFLPELLNLSHREGLIYTGDLVRIPWASDFAVTESEAHEILARLRDIPEMRSRIEGMVRVQASQFVVLSDLRTLAGQTLEMVEAARR